MILISTSFFAAMNVCVRLAGDVPVFQKALFRNLVAVVVSAGILIRNREGFLPTNRSCLPPLIGRAGFGMLGMLANFYAVDRLSMSDAAMLNKMSPFFAVIFCAVFLKEKLKPVQALTLVGAFCGAMCIVKPSFGNLLLVPSLIGFGGGVFAGLAHTMIRVLGYRGERGSYVVFFFSAFSCALLLPAAILVWEPLAPPQLIALLGTGFCAALGQFALTAAYRYAPAREISVYDYSQVIFAAILGFAVFGDIPDWLSVLGYVTICAMALWSFLYNNRHPS